MSMHVILKVEDTINSMTWLMLCEFALMKTELS